jgi:hypothetical protein
MAGVPRPVIQRGGEIHAQLEAEVADGRNATPTCSFLSCPAAPAPSKSGQRCGRSEPMALRR